MTIPPQYYLEKPDLSLLDTKEIISKLDPLGDKLRDLFEKSNFPDYLYWDKLKYKIPNYSVSAEEGWFFVRQFRNLVSNETLIKSEQGKNFRWMRLRYTDEYLHRIDMCTGGKISPKSFFSTDKNQLIVHGIMEEAIASSQLEGAHTTRAAAKKMLLENRIPTNKSEQMILNNYRAMIAIESEYTKSELSLELMFALHRQLTEGTDIAKDEIGRFRTDEDGIVVQGVIGTEAYVTHVPPKEAFLNKEIKRLIAFANDLGEDQFIHPIIKAIFLHFWIGYLHPFTDGNGRMARALFYWYLLKKGYWTMIYIPISTVIKHAPMQYAMAYIYSEQDNFDITYFYDFHIKKIIQALEEFESYIDKKTRENRKFDDVLGTQMSLNERQKQLLHHLISDDKASVTVTSHSGIHNVARQTAAKDLKELENKGFLIAKREGKFVRYYSSEKLMGYKGRI
ncbi:MAG: Fic family protein [Candidatus Gracilibacteria bacterium]|jgi:Fic family protein